MTGTQAHRDVLRAVAQPHNTLKWLVDEHGLDEVLRILAVIIRINGAPASSDIIGQARQAIHVNHAKEEIS